MPARRVALLAAIFLLLAHVATLWRLAAMSPGPLISDLIQFLLGIGATWASFSAGRRSGSYATKVWSLTAASLAIYTLGQGIVIFYDSFLHAPLFSPWISDQLLFFWVVPLAMAVLLDRWNPPKGLDWSLYLDFGQVFLVALALHLSIFGMADLWKAEGVKLAYVEWQVRMARDGIVLIAIFSKIWFSRVSKTREVFLRIGIFFLAYSLSDGIYLYAEAAWQSRVGTWLDLLWSGPRVLLIAAALTWQDEAEVAALAPSKRSRRQTLPL